MSKYTPGPWAVVVSGGFVFIKTVGGKPETICELRLAKGDESIRGMPETLARAELIAAAPDILDALRALFDEQNDAPLERRRKQWQAAFDRAAELLEKYDP